jgi:trk system potassium uptake protein
MKCTIIGLGQFGLGLALELARSGHEISVIDTKDSNLAVVKDHVTLAVRADATTPGVLEDMGLDEMDMVVVAIGEGFEASLLVTTALQKLGVKRLHVRVINDTHEHLLDLLGVEGKIRAERMAAESLVRTLTHDCILRHFALDSHHGVAELPAPASWVGRSLADSGLRQKHKLNLITVRRGAGAAKGKDGEDENAPVLGVLPPDFTFQEGDNLVVFGTESALEKFANRIEHGKG